MLLKVARVSQSPITLPSINRYTCPETSSEGVSSSRGARSTASAGGSDRKSSKSAQSGDVNALKSCTRCKEKNKLLSVDYNNKMAGIKYHQDPVEGSETHCDSDYRKCNVPVPHQQYNKYEDRVLPTINMNMNKSADEQCFQANVLRRARSVRPRLRKKKVELYDLSNNDDKMPLKVLQGVRCDSKTDLFGRNGNDKFDTNVKSNNAPTYISRSKRENFGLASYTAPNTRIEFATQLTVQQPKAMTMVEWLKMMSQINSDPSSADGETVQSLRRAIPIRLWRPELNQVLTNHKVDLHRRKLPAVGGSLAAPKGHHTARSIPCLGLNKAKLNCSTETDLIDRFEITPRTVKSATF